VKPVVSALQLKANDPVAVLINNLGGTTSMELAIFARGALNLLESGGLDNRARLCRNFHDIA